jgi:exodeoxyribonuclease VII large subunit
VQGAEAPAEIAGAIAYANYHQLADLLIVGRGGGSIEDLWAFNDEQVAYAIYHSDIPIISAVGHEPDVTISDFVADLREATPSNAAELAVPDQYALRQHLDSTRQELENNMLSKISIAKKHYSNLANSAVLNDPARYVHIRRDALRLAKTRLMAAGQGRVSKNKQHFVSLTAKLDALSPLKVLARGYSVVQDASGKVLSSVTDLQVDDPIEVRLSDGKVTAKITEIGEAL